MQYLEKLFTKYPAPKESNIHFTDEDIRSFEEQIGIHLPEDYYAFLRAYGYGSFSDYFYIWHPFAAAHPAEAFLAETRRCAENYAMLEEPFLSDGVDGEFVDGEFVQIRGKAELAEFLRVEEIDAHTRSKILFLGDHYPYDFYPEEGGLLYFGRTDEEEFFLRMDCGKQTIVMYSDGYYEFDMTVTEFIYEYLTCSIRIPMGHEEDGWEFVAYG